MQHIPNREDVWHIGLLRERIQLAGLGVQYHPGGLNVEVLGARGAAHCQHNCVKHLLYNGIRLRELICHLHLAVSSLLELSGRCPPEHFGAMSLHVGHNLLRHLTVEATQKHGAGHDCHVVAKSGYESSSLQGDVTRANAKGLARGLWKREDVVGSDAALLVTLHARIRGASTHCNNNLVTSNLGGLSVLLGAQNCVRILKGGLCVEVVNLRLAQARAITPVQRPDVVLNVGHHLLPVVLPRIDLPPKRLGVAEALAQNACLVHKLLRDAAYVHASATQPPGGSLRGRDNEIQACNLRAQLRGLFRSCQSARAPSNHNQVILVFVGAIFNLDALLVV
mmetsp:Transcript_10755/g.22387  ORF Transcript_10755/g.22387 Transcript_10755/m.22387 type:complete len:337 (-) Transcript_10755:135-1145(-)